MNTRQQGNKVENEIKKILIDKGLIVEKAQRTMRFVKGKFFSQANDFFGLFDLIAKDTLRTYWIQAKSNINHVYTFKKDVMNFIIKYTTYTDAIQVWLRVKKKGFIIYTYYPGYNDWIKSYCDLKGKQVKEFKIK